jgi:hypothetical protein
MKILESKVDINIKIAKILSNAMHWRIEFNATKGAKYTIALPISTHPSLPQERYEESKYNTKSIDYQYRT